MELEDQKKIEMCLEGIICSEANLVAAKNAKLQADENYKRRKESLEKDIKGNYYNIARLKRKAILRQKGLEGWSPADETLCDEESEKEFQRWKGFTPEKKLQEHKERISELEDEDWEPWTDLQVDRWIENEIEKD